MHLSDYGFAIFIFVLLCIFAFFVRQLFAGAKGRLEMLDEKEKKLLSLYATLEDVMDEFDDSVSRSISELDARVREIRRLADDTIRTLEGQEPSAEFFPEAKKAPPKPQKRPPAPAPRKSAPQKGEELPRTEEFEQLFRAPESLPKPKPTAAERKTRILELSEEGFDRVRIAKELSVTLSEVDLVLGMRSKK